ncbi:MAG: cyclic nucleotide-binding domain-containing protein, partial [Deltaproteobacteria bacterium]|nr:cyclic nucleotide-binding domain-containing protein [Deltaproteobacteria bacterium]
MGDEKLLKVPSILRGLDEEELGQFRKIARPVRVPRGKAILREGESGNTMYILQEGTVEVSKTMVMAPGGVE